MSGKRKSKKVCVITNIGAHYRFPVFQAMGRQLDCAFYLGDRIDTPLKTFDYSSLEGYRATLHNVFLAGHFYWQRHSAALVFKPYDYYILDGEPYCLSSWAILLLAKLRGKQTVAWTHGFYGHEHGIRKLVKKAFYSLFSKLMLYNEYAMNLMSQMGFPRGRMYCIANSLDSDFEHAVRLTLKPTRIFEEHFHNHYPTLIYCGRIQKRKKLELLVDAVALLRRQGRMVNVVFVGKDTDGVGLETYAAQAGLGGQVWMYGPCYDDYVLGELFYNAAVCVSPGNIGLTVIHALSFGCPAITHDNLKEQMPEFEAITPGVTGDLFRQDDVDDLCRVIWKWAGQTPEQRARTRDAAYKEIDSKWNIHHQMDVLAEVIQ